MSAYIDQLNKGLMAAQSEPSDLPNLQRKFQEWYRSLPAVTRERPFAMVEFEAALRTQGKYLGPMLLQLGWRRRRLFKAQGPYARYWTPPPTLESR